MKLTRKEFNTALADAQDVVLLTSAAERNVDGKLGIPIDAARACYFVLFDARHLQEMCQTAGFQPAGFRVSKMDPDELFVQFFRFVQKSGLGIRPLIELIDDRALDIAESDPEVFKVNILEPPLTTSMHDPDAECWAVATWLKLRLGKLDEPGVARVTEACHAWLRQPVPVIRPPAVSSMPFRDPSVEKAK